MILKKGMEWSDIQFSFHINGKRKNKRNLINIFSEIFEQLFHMHYYTLNDEAFYGVLLFVI